MLELSDRQKWYLQAAYRVEQLHLAVAARVVRESTDPPEVDPTPAMPFGFVHLESPPGPMRTLLTSRCRDVDEYSLRDWALMERQGLLTMPEQEVRHHPGQSLPHITLTAKGRRLARSLLILSDTDRVQAQSFAQPVVRDQTGDCEVDLSISGGGQAPCEKRRVLLTLWSDYPDLAWLNGGAG